MSETTQAMVQVRNLRCTFPIYSGLLQRRSERSAGGGRRKL